MKIPPIIINIRADIGDCAAELNFDSRKFPELLSGFSVSRYDGKFRETIYTAELACVMAQLIIPKAE